VANAWTIMPDWTNGVTESLLWLTDVLTSQSGAEQRRQLRVTPRRQIEMNFICERNERTLFDLAMMIGGSVDWLVPLFFDGGWTTDDFSAGAPAIGIDTTYTEFLAGTQVLIYGDAFNYEVHTIQSLSDSTITFAEVTSKDWPKGTRVYPLREAMLTDQPTPQKLTSRVSQGTIRFQMTANNGFAPATEYPDTYGGYPVLLDAGNEANAIDIGWERQILDLDGSTGVVWRTDTQSFANFKQSMSRLYVGKKDHATMRSLLYVLRGQLMPIWIPTFADDLFIAAPTSGNTIDVEMCGYSTYGRQVTGRTTILIQCYDGTRFYSEITGANILNATTERLNLSVASFGRTLTADTVKRISFMALARQSTDNIDILHHTDNTGASEITLTFRSTPEIRNVV
jgi:hypothetical protein